MGKLTIFRPTSSYICPLMYRTVFHKYRISIVIVVKRLNKSLEIDKVLHKRISEYDTSGLYKFPTTHLRRRIPPEVQDYSRSRTLLLHKQVIIYETRQNIVYRDIETMEFTRKKHCVLQKCATRFVSDNGTCCIV